MSDSSYVSGSLYKLGKKISETAKKDSLSSESAEKAAPSVDPVLEAAYQEKFKELQRVRRDVEMRLAEQSEYVKTCREQLSVQIEKLSSIQDELQKVSGNIAKAPEPDPASADFRDTLRTVCHEYENARIDLIKLSARVSGTDFRIGEVPQESGNGSSAFPADTWSIIRFFLPLGIWLLICSLILAGAFIFAWKVAL